jgi:hypothetical protein
VTTLHDLDKKVVVIQTQLREQAKDFEKMESSLERIRRSVGTRQTLLYLAALLPVYVLLFIAVLAK